MIGRIPCSSAVLSEARLYAIESYNHTMNYKGWEDQHNKMERLTYGKFAQLWVYEYCILNGIECEKDDSSPLTPDKKDLTICGINVDVKSSVRPEFLGQISPGMYNKDDGFYCFLLTDHDCTFIQPRGFISCADYMRHSIEVKKGDAIPGTDVVQRFGSSRFLRKKGVVTQFHEFMRDAANNDIAKHLHPFSKEHQFTDVPF